MNIKIDDNLIETIAKSYISFSKIFKKKMDFQNFLEYYIGLNNNMKHILMLYLDKNNK